MIYIYAYQNLMNGKVYIGQTKNLEDRDNHHVYSGQMSMVIDRAIKKYGRSSFDYWTICVVDTAEQAEQEEIFWISEMREKLGSENVYNILNGGISGKRGTKLSEESKKKIGNAARGRRNVSRKFTDDQIATIISVYSEGKISIRRLASIYSVDTKTMAGIVHGNTYKT